MGERVTKITDDELEHLIHGFKDHIEKCSDFKESDIQALEEVAKVWKVLQAIKEGGGWVVAGLLKMGSIGSAVAVLYMLWRGGK